MILAKHNKTEVRKSHRSYHFTHIRLAIIKKKGSDEHKVINGRPLSLHTPLVSFLRDNHICPFINF